jgi:hypothetical protein
MFGTAHRTPPGRFVSLFFQSIVFICHYTYSWRASTFQRVK